MKFEKLKSGSYRVKKIYNGVTYRVTFDHKPTQKEAEQAIIKKMGEPSSNGALTFFAAAEQMLEAKSNVLSPSTIRGYNNNLKKLSTKFKTKPIDKITQLDVQAEINKIAGRVSAKTTSNYNGFISSVMSLYRPDLALNVKLPMIVKEEPYIPSVDEVRALYKRAEGTPYLMCLYLGAYGMRRSEICGLTLDHVDGNTIHIRRAMVQNRDNEWVIKDYPKTTASARDIVVPDIVIEELKKSCPYSNHPHTISDWMGRMEKEIGMNHFSLHKLRHFFCSKSHELGLTDEEIKKFGGWNTDVMLRYRHATSPAEKVSSALANSLF